MESAGGEGQAPTVLEEGSLVSRSREVIDVSFRAFLAGQEVPRVGWAAPDGLEIVGGGRAIWLRAGGEARFDHVRAQADRLFSDLDHDGPTAARPRLIGGFSFDSASPPAEPWDGFPSAGFVLPSVQLTRWEGSTYLTVNGIEPLHGTDHPDDRLERAIDELASLPTMLPTGEPPGVQSTESRTSREEWMAMVESAVDRINRGELVKVVLATALDVDLESPIDIPLILERLRRTYPDCFRFLIQPLGDMGFFGPSPERLVRKEGERVETEALAGSVPRGETPEADAALADSLRESEKLQHEQHLVETEIADRLTPLGSVTTGEQEVRKLATIQHLRTPLQVSVDQPSHILSLVELLHPTPAVGGVPPERAMAAIRETEPFDRGWYASPVGWFDADGDGEFAVAIRSGLAGGHQATLFAGNGIVADSDPADEWDEIHPKYRPILDELE